MFFHNYPYSDAHELNLDWILRQIKELTSTMETFVNYASIKYADPILWNITSQYEQNTVVLDPQTGDGYLSTRPVPVGISLSNTEYWTAIFNYEARIQDVIDMIEAERDARIDDVQDEEDARILADGALGGRIDDEITDRTNADTALGGRIDTEITNRTNADNALGGRINDEIADRIAADNGLQSQIDALSNSSDYKSTYVNVRDIGAVGDGSVHTLSEYYATLALAQADYPFATSLNQTIDWAVIQKAFNQHSLIYIPYGNYMINSTINVRNTGATMVVCGDGSRQSVLTACNDNMTLIAFSRQATPGTGAIIDFKDMAFITSNTGVIGVSFKGQEVGGLRYEDNWIRAENIFLLGLNIAFDLAYCGNAYFNRIYAQTCGAVYRLGRAASFMHFYKNMSMGCDRFMYAADSLADGVSNGIFIEDCEAVFCSQEAIVVYGWQGVYITNSSCDLGTATGDQVLLRNCTDFDITGCWFAGSHVAGSRGVRFWESVNGCISHCSIVNVDHGVRIDGLTTMINSLSIEGNVFEGCARNEIIALNSLGVVITNNKMKDNIALSGTDADIYMSGCDHVILMMNEFACDSYSVDMGTNYAGTANIFGVRI